MAGIFTRTVQSINHARYAAPIIGWKWLIQEKYRRRLGVKEVKLQPVGLPHPVFCRVDASDIYEYSHLLGKTKVAMDLPRRPRYIVDAGANVGYSALRFQRDYPGATVVAIEPEARNVAQLRKNCGNYSNIHVERAAIWPRSTRLRIRSLDVGSSAFQIEEDPQGDVKAVSIEEIMRRYAMPQIDLLKLDIEGGERELFLDPSAKDWLKHVGILLIETHDRFAPGCTNAIDQATKELFQPHGMIDEYAFYTRK